MRRLKEYVNLSYDSEATIAAEIGADEGALNGWLAGKAKPTFQSHLKVRDFLERQLETRGGTCAHWLRADKGQQPEWEEREGRGKSDPRSSRGSAGTMSDRLVIRDW
jgi:hypothetical protein